MNDIKLKPKSRWADINLSPKRIQDKREWNAKERKLYPERVRERHRRYRLKQRKNFPDKVKIDARIRNKQWRIENPVKILLTAARSRARKKKLTFNISEADLLVPKFCPVLNIKLEFQRIKPSYYSPSIDRINNSKGYIKDNVRIISRRANTLKSNMTKEECELLLKDFVNVENNRTAH